MSRQSKRCKCHVAGVRISMASRIFDYPREVNSFSINLRIATFSEITRKTWCAESSMGENFDATMRANELRPREKLRIHVANSRFGPRSNQRRKFFATYIGIEISHSLAILWKLVTFTSRNIKEVRSSVFATWRMEKHELKLFHKENFIKEFKILNLFNMLI